MEPFLEATCPACGARAGGVGWCTQCLAPLPGAAPGSAPVVVAAPARSMRKAIDVPVAIAGAGGIVLVLSALLPWVTLSVIGIAGTAIGSGKLSGGGFASGTWTLVAGIVIAAVAGIHLFVRPIERSALRLGIVIPMLLGAFPLIVDGWKIWSVHEVVSGTDVGALFSAALGLHVGIGIWLGFVGLAMCAFGAFRSTS